MGTNPENYAEASYNGNFAEEHEQYTMGVKERLETILGAWESQPEEVSIFSEVLLSREGERGMKTNLKS